MEAKAKIILGIVGVAVLLAILLLAQGAFGEFLATRAPIPENTQDPDVVLEYTVLCEEACSGFEDNDLAECTADCLSLGEETF